MLKDKTINNISIQEIENIGVNIQKDISDQMTDLLKNTKCLDIGKSGNQLLDLSVTSNKITQKLNNVTNTKNPLNKMVMSSRRWLSKFDNLEKSIDNIVTNIANESLRLDSILNGLMASIDVMRNNLNELESAKDKLKDIINQCETLDDMDPDGFKKQAAISRLKVLTTTSTLTQQEIAKSILIIQENKEINNQLKEASQNLIPMFKTMMINIVATKANEDAIKLRRNLIKVANNIVLESANSIASNADRLIEGRKENLIDPKTLESANETIQKAVQRILNSATSENDINMQVIKNLESSTIQIKALTNMRDEYKVII